MAKAKQRQQPKGKRTRYRYTVSEQEVATARQRALAYVLDMLAHQAFSPNRFTMLAGGANWWRATRLPSQIAAD